MYDSSPEVVARLEPELRKRAWFVAQVLLRSGVVPQQLRGGHPRAAAQSFWGWPLDDLHTWHEEVHPGSQDHIHLLEEDTFENHFLDAAGVLVFEAYTLKTAHRRGRPDDVFLKPNEYRIGPAAADEIARLDHHVTNPYHSTNRRGHDRIEQWSVRRKDKPRVRQWGLGVSNEIDRLVARVADPATRAFLCPRVSGRT